MNACSAAFVFTGSPREPLSPSSVAGARAPVSLDLALSLRCDKGGGLWRMRMRYGFIFIYFYILFPLGWCWPVERRTFNAIRTFADSASSSFLVWTTVAATCQAVYMDHG